MSDSYIARAKVEFGIWGCTQPPLDGRVGRLIEKIVEGEEPSPSDYEDFDRREIPDTLPVSFGPFKLGGSPNEELYWIEVGPAPPPEVLPATNADYPVSLLYLDAKIELEDESERYFVADELLANLEALMRVFQDGQIYIRLHKMWKLDLQLTSEDDTHDVSFIAEDDMKDISNLPEDERWFAAVYSRAVPVNWYWRGIYDMSDAKLQEFVEFFNLYWDVLRQPTEEKWHRRICGAISRFSSSYEKRTLDNRLTELVIAMEALFGERGEQSYKVPLRCACLLYPAGEARKQAFKTIRRIYNERSRIVHGERSSTECDNEKLRQFEDHVRRSIKELLRYQKEGFSINEGPDLDDLLFFTGQGI